MATIVLAYVLEHILCPSAYSPADVVVMEQLEFSTRSKGSRRLIEKAGAEVLYLPTPTRQTCNPTREQHGQSSSKSFARPEQDTQRSVGNRRCSKRIRMIHSR